MKLRWISLATVLIASLSGCQCCPWFDSYANKVDDISDTHLYFDHYYNPRYDITRMGKPDWCSPFNSRLCSRACYQGCYDRYDDCNLYPPLTPTEFPSYVMPPPTIRTKREPRQIDLELKPMVPDRPMTQPGGLPPAPVPQFDK